MLSFLHNALGQSKFWPSCFLLATIAAGKLTANVTGFVDADGGQHFVYVDAANHIQDLVYSGSAVGMLRDVTSDTPGASTVEPGGRVASFATVTEEHWIFQGAAGHIYEIVYTPSGGSFQQLDVTALSGATTAAEAGSGVAGFVDGLGEQHVAYVNAHHHIEDVLFSGLTMSLPRDVTEETPGAVTVEAGSGLGGFATTSDQHWVFQGAGGHIYEIVYAPSDGLFKQFDLTELSGATTAAAPGSAVGGFVDSSGGQHFVYVDTNRHVEDILYDGLSVSAPRDLSAEAPGGVTVRAGSGLGSFAVSGDQHWVFMGADGHVQEIVGSAESGRVRQLDVSTLAGGQTPCGGVQRHHVPYVDAK